VNCEQNGFTASQGSRVRRSFWPSSLLFCFVPQGLGRGEMPNAGCLGGRPGDGAGTGTRPYDSGIRPGNGADTHLPLIVHVGRRSFEIAGGDTGAPSKQ